MGTRDAAHRVLHSERGAILVLSVVATFIVTLVAIALFDLSLLQNRLHRDNACTRRAVHVAEAGLLRAWQDIEAAPSGGALNFNTLHPAVGGGTLTTTLAPLGDAYTNVVFRTGSPDTYSVQARIVANITGQRAIRLVSTGRVPSGCLQESGQGGIAIVQADLTRQSSPLGAPFIGKEQIKGSDKVDTNSYNSFVGKYTDSVCPQLDAKGNPIKVLGCGGDLWTNGDAVTKTADKCDNSALCLKSGSTVYGKATASKGWIWVEGKKDKGTGAIWGDAVYDSQPSDFGNLYCKDVPCVNTTDPSKSVVQGSVVKGVIPPMNLQPVPDCSPQTSAADLNKLVTVVATKTGLAVPCGDTDGGGKLLGGPTDDYPCYYHIDTKDLSKNYWKVDKANSVTVQQGLYCLQNVEIKNPMTLSYDTDPTKVVPVQWSVKGQVKLDDKVAKGTTYAENESVPWLFMIMSSCDATTCKDKGVEVKIGDKTADSNNGLYGYIYAPYAAIKFNDKGDFFGAAVGRKLTLDKQSELHFDEALLDLFEFCTTTLPSATCTTIVPDFLTAKPADTLTRWKRCVPSSGGECA
jgi:Tfp pilus assembly protein PilX